MRIPLLRGRDVDASDDDVVLVSRSAARLLWGDADPLGRRVTLPLQSKTALKRVVGIVGDVKQGELFDDTMPTVYEYSARAGMAGAVDRRSLDRAARVADQAGRRSVRPARFPAAGRERP